MTATTATKVQAVKMQYKVEIEDQAGKRTGRSPRSQSAAALRAAARVVASASARVTSPASAAARAVAAAARIPSTVCLKDHVSGLNAIVLWHSA